MMILKRENKYGYKDYYDWDIEDNETVLIQVVEVCENRQGKPYIKAEYEDEMFYANISPQDADKLEDNSWYDMTCTGHTGQIKWLTFKEMPEPTPLLMEYLKSEPREDIPTLNIPPHISDNDADKWLREQREIFLEQRQEADHKLGLINNLITRTE